MLQLGQSSHWQQLQQLAVKYQRVHLRDLFAEPGNRFVDYSIELPSLLLDYSKNCVTPEVMQALFGLADDMDLAGAIERMYRGAKINTTEDRAVLHTALRNRSNTPVYVDQSNVMDLINSELSHMRQFVDQVRSGEWRGYSGKPITDVVNIGIGGSNLGPKMVTQALRSYANSTINVHFISNIDGVEVAEILRPLKAEQVLFVVASKTFTTSETMTNAQTARNWLMASAFDERAVEQHFVAVSSNAEAVQAFGIKPDFMFSMWDWVGGRYSLWSAIGLPIALYLGFSQFEELLTGAHDMDLHFRDAKAADNIPIIMALVGIWNGLLHGSQSQVILPYDQPLESFTAYIQQADMESNGKYVDRNGTTVNYATGPVIWGEPGTNGQHAFYQLIHQGTLVIPCDFIASANSQNPIGNQHSKLLSNYFAQTEALMNGKPEVDVVRELELEGKEDDEIEMLKNFKVFKGNNPTTSILVKELDPYNLGKLIAFYEHKIYVQGVFWNVFSFDQWGVELGKVLAKKILPELNQNKATTSHDSSTNGLINRYKKWSN